MIIFYHSADLDGHCSGAIARRFFKHAYSDYEIVMHGINYGDEFPWDKVENERVVMLDFSLQPFEDMIRLHEITKELVWIDHHKSAIEDSFGRDIRLWGKRQIDKAACELTWEYFFNEPAPTAVELLGKYDVWDHSNKDVLPFQYGMRLHDTDPAKNVFNWDLVFFDFPNHILGEGTAILKYVEQDNKKYVKSACFETNFEGHRCICVNKLFTNSKIFDAVYDPEKHDMMVAFGIRNKKWTVSMYAEKEEIDVSKIAKKFGGGGHKRAAGFQCDYLPFEVSNGNIESKKR